MTDLTHFDSAGQAHMVDVGDKPVSTRCAIAEGQICMRAETLDKIRAGDHSKGDVLGVARIAGIMAAKKTPELVPLCHPLALTRVEIELETRDQPPAVYCRSTVETRGQTGVEMEALAAVQLTLLTVYDMCKAVDRGMILNNVRLLKKSGGKSGDWQL